MPETQRNFAEKHYFCIMRNEDYASQAIELLSKLIATPSVSRQEDAAADIIASTLSGWHMPVHRCANNVWSEAWPIDTSKPTLLLNAHIDTVRPVASWTRNPYEPTIDGGILYGLGSNDCGGGLVSLLFTFHRLSATIQPYNLLFLASAEEEVSGENGIRRVLSELPRIDLALVGEPTGMQPAVAERGLMVLDITSHGRSGHAARCEGVNAIYEALDDLRWLHDYQFERESELLGRTMMNVTMISAGTQHNVVPDKCSMVVDVRTNECYTNKEVLQFISQHLKSDVAARSTRLQSSHISMDHPLVQRCIAIGKKPFGSPTLSDQALMPFTSMKMGPGESARSHTADEYILTNEISDALDTYFKLLDQLCLVSVPTTVQG